MLNTKEIIYIFKNYKKFLGVFSINLLPYVFAKRPSGLIVNLDPSYKPGSHWVAIYLPRYGPAHYFDSYGSPPPDEIVGFLNRNSKKGWHYNSMKFQGDLTTLCGYYCILFLLMAPNFTKFYKMFYSCNTYYNDYIIQKFKSVLKNIKM